MIPEIKKENTISLLDKKFIKVYDLQYAEEKHYFDATRRSKNDLAALMDDAEFRSMLPDAVTCIVILKVRDNEPRLLLSYEYRYPAGRFLLSPPAGLLDSKDKETEHPLISAALREIHEETGLTVDENAEIFVVNPLLFSSPGMTDESNAFVKVVLRLDDLSALNQDGAEGSECFDGFELVTKEEAKKLLADGRDKNGFFYSAATWIALMYFINEHVFL